MLRDIPLRHAITSLLSLGEIGIAGLAAAGEADEPRLAVLQQQLTQVQTQLQQLAQENRSLREGQHQLERRLAELAGVPGAVPVAGAPTAEASQALPASPSALPGPAKGDRKSTRLNSSHDQISYAVFCLKKKKKKKTDPRIRKQMNCELHSKGSLLSMRIAALHADIC